MILNSCRIMTADNRARVAEERGAVDRLSNLPINAIQNIIGRMPIRDAARTSILSSKWRYFWAEYPEVVLDEQFYAEIMRNNSPNFFRTEYVNKVNGILFQHLGPILKFVLDIPELYSTQYSSIDQWLLFVSRKDVTELILHNRSPNPYKVPCYAFSCPKLAYISVTKCIFSAPNSEGFFGKLTHLVLETVTFQFSVLNLPQLVQLELKNCFGIQLLCVSTPSLRILNLLDNDDLDLSYYITCKDLEEVCIGLSDGVEHDKLDKNITLTKLLGCWPELECLYLNGSFLKHLAAGDIPQRLPIDQVNSLISLTQFRITYHCAEIACILCLLQSALNLSELEIWADKQIIYDEKTVSYLKEPGLMKQSFKGLQTVIMQMFKGSTSELLLVKLLLACSPSLERMCIEENQDLDPIDRLNTSKELLRFSRASPKVEVIFQPGN
ncbi:F-box/FBD/LRR-repeat protein At1g13570-like isoform X1 [Coffea arabica]|uniref:F-box/FBD/LRR-repeat protein At1g13570-like isoform X1 n=3 Tax=Coffea arabica TaxID=13443 RepID=A0ABM4UAU2_COFAR